MILIRMDLGVIAMNRVEELQPHHHIRFSVIVSPPHCILRELALYRCVKRIFILADTVPCNNLINLNIVLLGKDLI